MSWEITAIDRFRVMMLFRAMNARWVPGPRGAENSGLTTGAETASQMVDYAAARAPDRGAARRARRARRTRRRQGRGAPADRLLRVQRIRASAAPVIETSRHLVFTGNPGTGKTTVARLLSQIYCTLGVVVKGHLVETDRPTSSPATSARRAIVTHDILDVALGGMLLIDEAYALARGGDNDFGREAIDTLVKLMEDHRDDLAIIAAGYPEEMRELHRRQPGLGAASPRTIAFPDYTADELVRSSTR